MSRRKLYRISECYIRLSLLRSQQQYHYARTARYTKRIKSTCISPGVLIDSSRCQLGAVLGASWATLKNATLIDSPKAVSPLCASCYLRMFNDVLVLASASMRSRAMARNTPAKPLPNQSSLSKTESESSPLSWPCSEMPNGSVS